MKSAVCGGVLYIYELLLHFPTLTVSGRSAIIGSLYAEKGEPILLLSMRSNVNRCTIPRRELKWNRGGMNTGKLMPRSCCSQKRSALSWPILVCWGSMLSTSRTFTKKTCHGVVPTPILHRVRRSVSEQLSTKTDITFAIDIF